MLRSIIKHALLIAFILIFQLAVMSPVAKPAGALNLVLVVVIFIAVAFQFYYAVIYAMILGFILDIYSALPFGAILMAMLLTLYCVHEIFNHFLTNKSFYTLIGLISVATLIFNFIVSSVVMAERFWATKDWSAVLAALASAAHIFYWQLILNIGLTILIFIFFHFSSRRFNAVFIDTSR